MQITIKTLWILLFMFLPIQHATWVEAHTLDQVLSGEHRSEKNKSRDVSRHPKETLEFFGIEEGMTVVEVWPSSGWYTEILAPYLNESGQYITASYDLNTDREPFVRFAPVFLKKLAEYPELYSNVRHGIFELPERVEIADPDSVDMVLTFRNVHNWMASGQEQKALRVFYNVLKPGGILGVVEHRGDPSVKQDPKAKSGYVNQAFMIELAETVGFVLEASSEINANPRDTKDHRQGVWTLPPTFASLNEDERKIFRDIGESDRFTLKFKKPE
jgi:predicted methyltransferase